ncbi:uncharacterized protein LOC117338355 [Pecten maximus]|uniref:uncharacterized protein LOC117338355 n=1 Tax=Pecten maximus TaxID=6579 RepID=UPI001457F4DE|nr:uncharacterized protein LOC117338355 [Pecten maximus]
MALNNRYLRFGVTNEEVEKTTVMLRSDSRNNASSLQINIENGRELHSDLIYVQVSGNISNVIFHSFLRPSECRVFTCPHDVMRNSLATVTVYSVKTFRDKRCVWHRIVMGGRTSAILKGGFTINYLKVKLQPYRTYLDLLTDAPNKIPYHIDVVSTIPQRYMLTDEDYRGDTDGLILLLHQIHPPDAFLVMFRRRPEKTYRIPFVLNPAAEYKQQLFRVYTRHDTEDVCTGDSHSTVTTFTTCMYVCSTCPSI